MKINKNRNQKYEFSCYNGEYLHIQLKDAKFATKAILISKIPFFLEERIKKAQQKLINLEELSKKYFH